MNTDYININDVLDYPDNGGLSSNDNGWRYEYEYWSAVNDFANIVFSYGLAQCTNDLMKELSKRQRLHDEFMNGGPTAH